MRTIITNGEILFNELLVKNTWDLWTLTNIYPAGNYMFKVDNINTRTKYEICTKLTIKTLERRHCFYC